MRARSTGAITAATAAGSRGACGAVIDGIARQAAAQRPDPRLASASTARAACHPGMPVTPPPAWVAECAWYSPAIGER